MTYTGHVRKNMIVLDGGVSLPDGTRVRVEPIPPASASPSGTSLLDHLGELVGSVPDLPEDFAKNHNYPTHGEQ